MVVAEFVGVRPDDAQGSRRSYLARKAGALVGTTRIFSPGASRICSSKVYSMPSVIFHRFSG